MKSSWVPLVALSSVLTAGCDWLPPAQPALGDPSQPRPEIVTLSPDTIPVKNGRAIGGTYTIKYTIANADQVTAAHVEIGAPGIGDVSPRVVVPIQKRGTVVLTIDPARVDLGPTVRLRAVCPERTTEWYTLGSEPLPYKELKLRPLVIERINPPYIGYRSYMGGAPDGTGERIKIMSKAITPACTHEMTVNDRPVELNNPVAQGGEIGGLLLYRDIDNRMVSARYLEVKLALDSPKGGVMAIQRLKFAE